jgi:uncharacterized membrane protein YdfJ with MMPL/SSD domain
MLVPEPQEGLGRTGRLITSAALILCLAFAALAAGPQTDIKIFATGLGAGILLDATVVRALLVPALMSLLGSWNWWLPGWLERLLLLRHGTTAVGGAADQAAADDRLDVTEGIAGSRRTPADRAMPDGHSHRSP